MGRVLFFSLNFNQPSLEGDRGGGEEEGEGGAEQIKKLEKCNFY